LYSLKILRGAEVERRRANGRLQSDAKKIVELVIDLRQKTMRRRLPKLRRALLGSMEKLENRYTIAADKKIDDEDE